MNVKNILVTGGAGFIGSNFIHYALTNRPAWRIVNLDALTYAGNLANFKNLPVSQAERHRFVHGHIQDMELIENLLKTELFRGVVHFAAESHVDRSIHDPESFLKTNVSGTFQLIEAVLKHWKRIGNPKEFRFLHISTDEVYGSLGPQGYFTESTPYDPSSPYSASKAAADHFVKAFYRTYGFPAIISNCSNNFGPFQFPEKLIPLVILNIVERKPLPVYGDGTNIRDWLYVIDHCDALLKIFEEGILGETYNIGGNNELKNIEVVQLLCDIMDCHLNLTSSESSRHLIKFVSDRPGHDKRYAIDSSKLRKVLRWKPAHTFKQALEKTVKWYLENSEWVESVRTGEYRDWMEINYESRDKRH